MKHELKITEDNYREVVLKRGIITCWILLAICLVVKIFGGNFFNIVCNDENFVKICNYIDNTWIFYSISYISFIMSSVLLLLIVRDDKKLFTKNTLMFWIIISIYWIFKLLVQLNIIPIDFSIYNILDLVSLYLFLLLFSKKKVKPIIAIILMFIFTFASVFIKNTGITYTVSESALVGLIFMIDYYIMLILTYLYSKKLIRRKK